MAGRSAARSILELRAEQASQLPAEVGAALFDLGGDEWVTGRGDAGRSGRRRDGLEQSYAGLRESLDLGARRIGRAGADLEQRPGGCQLAIDRSSVEVVDVIEVAEQGAEGDAGPLGDLRHARLEHTSAEQADQGVEHGLPVVRPSLAPPVDLDRHVGHRAEGRLLTCIMSIDRVGPWPNGPAGWP